MDETRTEESVHKKGEADTRSAARRSEAHHAEKHSEETQPVSGMEINLGDFTRTQGLMKSLRLMLNNQIMVQVEEIASGVGEAGRNPATRTHRLGGLALPGVQHPAHGPAR